MRLTDLGTLTTDPPTMGALITCDTPEEVRALAGLLYREVVILDAQVVPPQVITASAPALARLINLIYPQIEGLDAEARLAKSMEILVLAGASREVRP